MDFESGFTDSFTHRPSTVTQTIGGSSVGGVVVPTNTLAILAPYLATIGLVAIVAIAVKKRRN